MVNCSELNGYIRLLKTMPIINHRHFKSQAFYFEKNNFLTLHPPSHKRLHQIGETLLNASRPRLREGKIYGNDKNSLNEEPSRPKDAGGGWGRSVK
jgi:hypothetical protein